MSTFRNKKTHLHESFDDPGLDLKLLELIGVRHSARKNVCNGKNHREKEGEKENEG